MSKKDLKNQLFHSEFSVITPGILNLTALCYKNSSIDPELFKQYNVNRGLRDLNGDGVLTGLTEISEIQAFDTINGVKAPCEGKLFYRGYNVEQIVDGFISKRRFGFEETTYLLMFGKLPDQNALVEFSNLLADYRALPSSFARDIIMKAPNLDMMNTLARSVLTLHAYDDKANDTSIPNVLRQCLQLIALFPQLSIYGYHTYKHYFDGHSLVIHAPKPELSTAENILYMLRPDSKYTELESRSSTWHWFFMQSTVAEIIQPSPHELYLLPERILILPSLLRWVR